jgi:hypothetical protein
MKSTTVKKAVRSGDKLIITFTDDHQYTFEDLLWAFLHGNNLCIEEHNSGPSGPWTYPHTMNCIEGDGEMYPSMENRPIIGI